MIDDIMQKYVPNVHFELLSIDSLVSNQNYQRALSEKHIKKTAANFDIRQVNPVKVSRRDGINYVFDGQHTIEIIAAVSKSRETPVWCMIYDDMDYIEEADTFANQQKFTRNLVPIDIFNANIEAENSDQMNIKSLVESYKLKISAARGDGCICAVSSLEYIYHNYGFHVLDRTLRLLVGTWEGEANSLSSNMIKGVATLAFVYEDKIRDDMFIEKVGALSSKEIARTAKERGGGKMGFAEVMLSAYNKKMKYSLNWTKMYEVKSLIRARAARIAKEEAALKSEKGTKRFTLSDETPENNPAQQQLMLESEENEDLYYQDSMSDVRDADI